MRRKVESEGLEEIPRRLGIFAMLFVLFILFGTIAFMVVDMISFGQALHQTLESIALSHNAKSDAGKFVQKMLEVIGVFILWWTLWNILDIIFADDHFSEYVHKLALEGRIKKMKNHYIIAGGGRVGQELAARLTAKRHNYILIESDLAQVQELRRKHKSVIHGDAADSAVLLKAGIEQAHCVMLALPETEKNLLVALLAREHNPHIIMHARADTDEYVNLLKKAGVSVVVIPELAAVDLLMRHIA